MGLLPHATFVVVGAASVLCTLGVVMWLGSISEIKEFSAMQYGIAVGYALMLGLWLGAEAGFFVARYQPPYHAVDTSPAPEEMEEDGELMQKGSPKDVDIRVGPVLKSQLVTLRAWGEFIFYMGYIYLCDRTPVFSKGPKLQGSMRFWAVNVVLLLCGLATLRSSGPGEVKPLQRDQTEEWKGWMQLMFILYHYFAEAPRPPTQPALTLQTDPGPRLHPWTLALALRRSLSPPPPTPPPHQAPNSAPPPGAHLQRDPPLHRLLRVDDGLRQLLLLLRQGRLHAAPLRADDVAAPQHSQTRRIGSA